MRTNIGNAMFAVVFCSMSVCGCLGFKTSGMTSEERAALFPPEYKNWEGEYAGNAIIESREKTEQEKNYAHLQIHASASEVVIRFNIPECVFNFFDTRSKAILSYKKNISWTIKAEPANFENNSIRMSYKNTNGKRIAAFDFSATRDGVTLKGTFSQIQTDQDGNPYRVERFNLDLKKIN